MMQAHHTMHPLQIIRGSAKYIALMGICPLHSQKAGKAT